MNIHEFQAKRILEKYGIPMPRFAVISDTSQVGHALNQLGFDQAVVKVQVHAGGRGKAGGVKFAKSRQEIEAACRQLLGMRIVNNQTGSEGVVAHQLMLSAPVAIKKEYYLGAVIDRQRATATLIASPEGGMEIEEVAAKSPDKVLKVPIQINGKVRTFHLTRLAKMMGWEGDLAKQGLAIVKGVAQAFIDTDASLLEINPLVATEQGEMLALDAKLTIDDNALFRQPEIAACYDPTQIPKDEALAKQYELAYIALDGQIGCMVNGAGLAMATMDIIQHYGGSPSNFLDVGGGASQEKVAEGFKLILSDPKVKGILVNIFGGIMNCATLAAGIVAAAKELQLRVPLVVRMEGTNVDQGRQILKDSKLNIIIAQTIDEAAQKIVNAVNG
jgi:succinyl-CoA synthetase beta subunit